MGFDDSTLQPTLELVLRGATEESAGKFAAAVRKAVDGILEKDIPEELLMASLNSTEFASLERPGSIPDGVLDASMHLPDGSTPATRPCCSTRTLCSLPCGRSWNRLVQ